MKPLLAATLEDLSKLQFPVVVSPKLDGLRCIIRGGVALSRNLKPFRNAHVQRMLSTLPDCLDGELIVGEPNRGHVLNRTQSGIMSTGGDPAFTFHMFDHFRSPLSPFVIRLNSLASIKHPVVKIVPHKVITSLEELLEFERATLLDGYEGIMVRKLDGKYKFGRSTLPEGILSKFKRFSDGEAVVESLLEGVTNKNEATLDALGHTKRSHHQDSMEHSGQVGTIVACEIKTGKQLFVSPGRMPFAMRKYYWENPHKLVGETINIKWFGYGNLNAPRFCTFQSIRIPE